MILLIYTIGVVILFTFLLKDELTYTSLLRRRDLAKIFLCSLGSWVVILIIASSYLLSYCEDWLDKPVFNKSNDSKNQKNKN